LTPEAVKKIKGRDALLRVRNRKPNPDAGHRVPTQSGSCGRANFFTAPRVGCERIDQRRGPQRTQLPRFLFSVSPPNRAAHTEDELF
jgi:hypothetical protein